jgi:chorismate lyase
MVLDSIENKWSIAEDLTARVPHYLLDWILCKDSTTAKIRKLTDNQLVMNIISEEFSLPMENEAKKLIQNTSAHCLVRKALMQASNLPWLYCRSVFPKKTLTGEESIFSNLGSQPIGDILFGKNAWARSLFELSELTTESLLYQEATEHLTFKPDSLWARRSVFALQNKSILITEVFLPAFLEKLEHESAA